MPTKSGYFFITIFQIRFWNCAIIIIEIAASVNPSAFSADILTVFQEAPIIIPGNTVLLFHIL